MPGRIMDVAKSSTQLTNGVVSAEHSYAEPSGTQKGIENGALSKPAAQRFVNGDRVDTGSEEGIVAKAVNGSHSTPPDLGLPEEFWEGILSTFMPLSVLFQRLAQDCMNELDNTITRMAELGPSSSEKPNGVTVNGTNSQAAAISLEKKRLILDFSNSQREKFIKLLVISQWTQKANDDIEQLIKLRTWLQWRMDDIVNVAVRISKLKFELQAFKEPDPDILTALELLTTGSASWLPSYDYMPKPKVSETEMLRTLKDLNVLISLRLNLHEELVRPLRSYSIRDGRATFVVPGEFEFDVTIADEDPTTPWYWLDIRFLFSPAPEIPDGALRVALEDKANLVLRDSGLNGCYEFLHDLALTHKISLLRQQAQKMSRGAWSNSLRIEMVRRSLVVQYWTGLSSKSWIEIGLVSNKSSKRAWRGPEPSSLGVRWTRAGAEVLDAHFNFDWITLSMEKILRQVIAEHMAHLLHSIEEALPRLPGGDRLKSVEMVATDIESSEYVLQVAVNGRQSPISLTQELVTGRMVVQPPSSLATRTEAKLNSHHNKDISQGQLIADFCAADMQQHTERQVEILGWKVLKNLRLDNVSRTLAHDSSTTSFFRGHGWGSSSWVMAATYDLSGESWWVVEIADAALGTSIKSQRPISAQYHKRVQDLFSLEPLRRIESLAIAVISFSVNAAQLSRAKAAHGLINEAVETTVTSEGDLNIDTPVRKLVTLVLEPDKLFKAAHAREVLLERQQVRVNVLGLDKQKQLVRYNVRGQFLKPKDSRAKTLSTSIQEDSVRLNPSGHFTLRVAAPFTTPCLDVLVTHLTSLQRLRTFVSAVRASSLPIKSSSLMSITFNYPPPHTTEHSSYHLSGEDLSVEATITFPSVTVKESYSDMTLTLDPSSPHCRIKTLLQEYLNSHRSNICYSFLNALRITLPLLRTFDLIEDRNLEVSQTSSPTNLGIRCHSLGTYRLQYRSRGLLISIRAQRVRDSINWFICEIPSDRQPLQRPQSLTAKVEKSPALVEVLTKLYKQRGEGWRGLSSCIMANTGDGIVNALLWMDECVRTETLVPTTKSLDPDATSTSKEAAPTPILKQEVITLD